MTQPCTRPFAVLALIMALTIMTAVPCTAAEPRFTGLVVFGDSLSDNGNAGRFSNGPVWVEHLASRLGLPLAPSRQGGTNHAVGGARTHGGPDDLRAQADAHIARHRRLDPGRLYIVHGGGNDLLAAAHIAHPGFASLQHVGPERIAEDAARAIAGIVADLAAAGAVHILVPNLPDIGRTPALLAAGPSLAAVGRRLSRSFNATLDRALDAIRAPHPLRLYRLDVFALLERVAADPAAAGFTDLTTPCLAARCDGHLFYDQVHPTTHAHARLAAAALAVALPRS